MTRSVPAPPSGKKVAIVGGARSRRGAPYDDSAWEIWAFSSLRVRTPRITRWFEMHALGDLKGQLRKQTRLRWSYGNYVRFLKRLDRPIYMQRTHKSIPTSVEYPLQDALDAFGRCFTSTVAYLLALAIMERYETIGVWGVHLTDRTVYARQRPGVEYLLGVAMQRGIDVYLPRGCPLRIPARPRLSLARTDILYGYDWRSPKAWWRKKRGRRRPGTTRRNRRS